MDYKVIIILLALLFLIILVYREVTNIKDNLHRSSNYMTLQHNKNSDNMMLKFRNDMDRYVTQIKGISSDNLQQLRKITLLNHQNVVRNNHFTETDNSEFKTNMHYLSENPNDKIFIKKDPSNDFYMSEDETKNKKNDSSSNCAERSQVCDGDYCPIDNKDNKDNKDNDQEIPIYVSQSNKINTIDEDDTEDDYTELSTKTDIQAINHLSPESHHDTANMVVGGELNKSKNNLENSIIEDDGYNTEENIVVTPIIYKPNPKHKNEIEVFNIITDNKLLPPISQEKVSEIIKTGNDIKLNDIYINDTDSDKTDSDKLTSEDTFDANNAIQRIDLTESVKKLLEEKDKQIDNLNKEQDNNSTKSNSSRKSAKSVKKQDKPILCVDTSVVRDIELKTLDEYTFNDLRDLARKLNVPTTYKEKNKSKQYKKEELFNNIKAFLKK